MRELFRYIYDLSIWMVPSCQNVPAFWLLDSKFHFPVGWSLWTYMTERESCLQVTGSCSKIRVKSFNRLDRCRIYCSWISLVILFFLCVFDYSFCFCAGLLAVLNGLGTAKTQWGLAYLSLITFFVMRIIFRKWLAANKADGGIRSIISHMFLMLVTVMLVFDCALNCLPLLISHTILLRMAAVRNISKNGGNIINFVNIHTYQYRALMEFL